MTTQTSSQEEEEELEEEELNYSTENLDNCLVLCVWPCSFGPYEHVNVESNQCKVKKEN